jgi:hypothetical protein
MKLVWWMLSVSILSSLILALLWGTRVRIEIWLGMIGPLASAIVSWIAIERRRLKRPEALTSLMIKSFTAKMIFFAAYITVLLKTGWVRPNPFVVSFIGYFVLLYGMEAMGLHRLQSAANSAAPRIVQGHLGNG